MKSIAVYAIGLAGVLTLNLSNQDNMKPVDGALIRAGLLPLSWNWVEKEDTEGLMSFQLVEGDVTRFALYQYREKEGSPISSLGVSAGYDLADRVDPLLINDWNKLTRFTKAYFDEEGDPFLTSDMRVGLGSSAPEITEFIREFRTEQKEFERVVLGREVILDSKL